MLPVCDEEEHYHRVVLLLSPLEVVTPRSMLPLLHILDYTTHPTTGVVVVAVSSHSL